VSWHQIKHVLLIGHFKSLKIYLTRKFLFLFFYGRFKKYQTFLFSFILALQLIAQLSKINDSLFCIFAATKNVFLPHKHKILRLPMLWPFNFCHCIGWAGDPPVLLVDWVGCKSVCQVATDLEKTSFLMPCLL
jgi:hypothetical protein